MNLPELFVTGLDAQGDFTFRPWCPPPVDDFATPADLARIIAAFRSWVQANTSPSFRPITEQGAVSEQGLGRLLLLAYQASFYPDEGRYTRARIFVPDVDRKAHPALVNHVFTPPKRLSDAKMISGGRNGGRSGLYRDQFAGCHGRQPAAPGYAARVDRDCGRVAGADPGSG